MMDLKNMDLSKIDDQDVEIVKEFIKHFNLPDMPQALTEAIDKMDANGSYENKKKFVRELVAYLASSDVDLVSVDSLFATVKDEIIKVDNQFKEGDK